MRLELQAPPSRQGWQQAGDLTPTRLGGRGGRAGLTAAVQPWLWTQAFLGSWKALLPRQALKRLLLLPGHSLIVAQALGGAKLWPSLGAVTTQLDVLVLRDTLRCQTPATLNPSGLWALVSMGGRLRRAEGGSQ